MSYDIIGDIHGHAEALKGLLRKLGYAVRFGTWRHPQGRTAVFLGDFIDRGPAQLETARIARRMIDAGSALAVMGNHELNAIAWATPDPQNPGEFLRPHEAPPNGPKNRAQHAAFLAEVERDPALHQELVGWFLSLPLWLELPGCRVVHACWHPHFLRWVEPMLSMDRILSRELIEAATREPEDKASKDTPEPTLFKAVEALLKGVEIPMPAGQTFKDGGGHERDRVRVKWWDAGARTYRAAAFLDGQERDRLPDAEIPANAILGYPAESPPVFVGHYWLQGVPVPLAHNVACLDYSVAKQGRLSAYRFDGEPVLDIVKFVSVDPSGGA